MDASQLIEHMQKTKARHQDLRAPTTPGVYGFFLTEESKLRGVGKVAGPLYIGTTGNLAQREFDTHFASGQTGFSTLRRSLGALLKEELDLVPIPRGTGTSRTNFTNYRFGEDGEERLSDWMTRNLVVAVAPLSEPDQAEKELIALACPPLNLTGWSNPDASAIKAARKECADIARGTRPQAG